MTEAATKLLLARRVHFAVLGTWTFLLALVWSWSLSRGLSAAASAWALFWSLPLLAPLPGLWSGRRYTHAWATLCVLPYLVVGITESIANADKRFWASAILGAALLLFFSLIAYLRVTRRLSRETI